MIYMKNYIFCASILVCFLLFYAAGWLYPVCSDDFAYMYVCGASERLSGLSDVFVSQMWHWMYVNGRFVAHCAVQFFLMLNKEWFNVANALCYAVCTGGIAVFASCLGRKRLEIWLLALISFWVLMPHAGSTMFWLTGSFNYLWSSCFLVLFLCCLFSQSPWLRYGAILLGVIAGNGHECLSIGGLCALLLYALLTPRRDCLFYIALCSYAAGMLTNVLAPGNMVRLSGTGTQDGMSVITLYCASFAKVIWASMCSFSDLALVVARVFGIMTLIACYRSIRRGERGYVLPFCFAIGAFMTLGLNAVAKTYYPRAFYGFCFFSYLGFMMMLGEWVSTNKHRRIFIGVVLFVLLVNCIEIPRAYGDILSLREVYSRVKQGAEEKHTIIEGIEDWDKVRSSRYAEVYGISDSALCTHAIQRYYGVPAISIHPPVVYAYIIREKASLLQNRVHESHCAFDGWKVVKLQGKPKAAKLMRRHVTDFSGWPEFVKTMGKKFFPPKTIPMDATVFCLSGEYFVLYSELQPGDSVRIKYPADEEFMIES